MRKNAFTLTELLVVVVIIGVLSAVVLPKFSKTLETRRTTEAEDIMQAVRTEQEYRCAADKAYTTKQTELSSLEENKTKNYVFKFEKTGMVASRSGREYKLKMLSYADGRICCEGAGCSGLNKNYPTCSDLEHMEDFKTGTSCVNEEKEADPDSTPLDCTEEPLVERTCPAGCGKQTRDKTCNHATGEWEYGAWGPSCPEKPEDNNRMCECGYVTGSAVCENDVWKMEYPPCDPKPESTFECDCGSVTRSVTCQGGAWKTGEFDPCPTAITEEQPCGPGMAPESITRTQVCKNGAWTWDGVNWSDTCKKDCAALARDACGIVGWEPAEPNTIWNLFAKKQNGAYCGNNSSPHGVYNDQEYYIKQRGEYAAACIKKNREAENNTPSEWAGRRMYYWDFRDDGRGHCEVRCRLDDVAIPAGTISPMSTRVENLGLLNCQYGVHGTSWGKKPVEYTPPNNQVADRDYHLVADLGKAYDKDACYVTTHCPSGYWEAPNPDVTFPTTVNDAVRFFTTNVIPCMDKKKYSATEGFLYSTINWQDSDSLAL
jgi:prepilin-type N-terminal cleavage/methylation domain-containing protein